MWNLQKVVSVPMLVVHNCRRKNLRLPSADVISPRQQQYWHLTSMNDFFLPFVVSVGLGTFCGCFAYAYVLSRWQRSTIRFWMCFFILSLISLPLLTLAMSVFQLVFGRHWQVQRFFGSAMLVSSLFYPIMIGIALIVLVCLGARNLGSNSSIATNGLDSGQLKPKQWLVPCDHFAASKNP